MDLDQALEYVADCMGPDEMTARVCAVLRAAVAWRDADPETATAAPGVTFRAVCDLLAAVDQWREAWGR